MRENTIASLAEAGGHVGHIYDHKSLVLLE